MFIRHQPIDLLPIDRRLADLSRTMVDITLLEAQWLHICKIVELATHAFAKNTLLQTAQTSVPSFLFP